MPLADNYSPPNMSGPHPLTELFQALRAASLQASTTIKTIVSFRKQADLLGSLYAQFAPGMAHPGQRDFLRKVDSILTDDAGDFDYSFLAKDLVDYLGSRNVLFLFFEDGLGQNIDKIGHFIDFDFGIEPAPEEKKRFAGGAWSSDEMHMPLTKNGVVGSFRRFFDRKLSAGGPAKRNLMRWAANVDALVLQHTKPKQVLIRVPEELDNRIKLRFSTSNKDLETLVHRDLGELGYY